MEGTTGKNREATLKVALFFMEKPMGRIASFIDGAYLDFILRDELASARIDYALLSKKMAEPHELLRTSLISEIR